MTTAPDPNVPPPRQDPPPPARDRDPPARDRIDPVLDLAFRDRDQHRDAASTAQREAAEARAATAAAVAEREQAVAAATAAGNARLIDMELRLLAREAGITDLDFLALPSFDRSSVKVDKDGAIKGAPEAIAAFKAAKPTYFAQSPAERGDTTTRAAPPVPGVPKEFNARTAEAKDYTSSKQAMLAAARRR